MYIKYTRRNIKPNLPRLFWRAHHNFDIVITMSYIRITNGAD